MRTPSPPNPLLSNDHSTGRSVPPVIPLPAFNLLVFALLPTISAHRSFPALLAVLFLAPLARVSGIRPDGGAKTVAALFPRIS